MEKETSLMILEHDKALGRIFVESGFFADAKKESEAIVKILAGREVGLKPIEAMTGIHIIKGKITFGANMMAAAVKKSGHYDYRVTKHTATECIIDFSENKNGKWDNIGTSSFTIEEAKQIGLTSNSTWKNYPKAMLFARALSAGVRYYCPDVFGHSPVYVPEEMGAEVDEEGEPINITPKKPLSQHYNPETQDNPHETTGKAAETHEKGIIPNNPMPYLTERDNLRNDTETPSNVIQIPKPIMEKITGKTPREAFTIIEDYAFRSEQGKDLKLMALKVFPDYQNVPKFMIPESDIMKILKEIGCMPFNPFIKTEKTPKCKSKGCKNILTEPEAEKRDNLCREHFKGDMEDQSG